MISTKSKKSIYSSIQDYMREMELQRYKESSNQIYNYDIDMYDV